MAEPFLGAIIIFGGNFAPRGWAMCNGQILSINQNTALFSLLGTTYGGNGQTTFALPDLRGRAPIHFGQGPGLSNYSRGRGGRRGERHAPRDTRCPATRTLSRPSNGEQDTNRPNNAVPARGGVYAHAGDGSTLAPTSGAGGSQPHDEHAALPGDELHHRARGHLPLPELSARAAAGRRRRRAVPARAYATTRPDVAGWDDAAREPFLDAPVPRSAARMGGALSRLRRTR